VGLARRLCARRRGCRQPGCGSPGPSGKGQPDLAVPRAVVYLLGATRDPRGWSASIAYYALVSADTLRPASPAPFELWPVDELPRLCFDHARIVDCALERLRSKSAYSSLPCYLLPPAFTLTELQQTYEHVLGQKLDKSAFRRKLADFDFLEVVKDAQRTGSHRPAQLYRIREEKNLMLFDRTI
jgi:8-oxo-dGTP diphosphatase